MKRLDRLRTNALASVLRLHARLHLRAQGYSKSQTDAVIAGFDFKAWLASIDWQKVFTTIAEILKVLLPLLLALAKEPPAEKANPAMVAGLNEDDSLVSVLAA